MSLFYSLLFFIFLCFVIIFSFRALICFTYLCGILRFLSMRGCSVLLIKRVGISCAFLCFCFFCGSLRFLTMRGCRVLLIKRVCISYDVQFGLCFINIKLIRIFRFFLWFCILFFFMSYWFFHIRFFGGCHFSVWWFDLISLIKIWIMELILFSSYC